MNKLLRHIALTLPLLLFACTAAAQKMPERSELRKGNRAYDKGEYSESVARYESALKMAPASFEAGYNLGNALYKAERYDNAEKTLEKVTQDSLRTDIERSEAFYNLGNARFQQKKYQEALESYRQAMRLNPDDREAKYNYAYTKRLLENNDQNQQQQQDQQDKKNQQDQQQQQQGGDNQQQNDPSKQDGKQDGKQDPQQNGKQDPQQGQDPQKKDGEKDGQPLEAGISPQEQQQMLDAIQAQEDKTQEKLKEKKGVIVRGKKNW